MNLNEYQLLALRTASPLPFRDNLLHAALGLASEAGEVADAVKKHVAYGRDLDRANVIEEIGDILWFVSLMAHTLDVTLAQVAGANIAKLAKRYPNLEFDAAHALHRDLVAEAGAIAGVAQ